MHVMFVRVSGINCEMNGLLIQPIWARDVCEYSDGRCTTKFRENTSIVVVGRTGSGKTSFIYKLLRNVDKMFEGNRKHKILYLYKSDQDLFREMEYFIPDIEFHEGMLSSAEILSRQKNMKETHLIVVFDDLMRETIDSLDVMDLFSINCHHAGCTVILVSHNIFHQGRYSKTIAVNAGYVVLFASMEQIQRFGRQRFPVEKNMILNIYKKVVCDNLYGYIVLDMNANVCRYLRIKSNIFPDEITSYYYDPKYVDK